MEKRLELSKDLNLPAEDLLESAIGIIGKRGRGKTGLVKVLMEELVRMGLPFISFDPVGVAWGLRSNLTGTGPGLPVLVVGGSHGDLRLDRRAGAEVARAVVQANVSCIVDFSEESKTVYREFVKDFSHTLFAINETPRIVIIEEAPELVPQRLRPDMMEVFEAVERLVSRGRNKGLGVVLVSQRAATINKDVLTQVDALFIFGLVSPQDRKALVEWVEAHDAAGHLKEFEEGIASLARQECWVWAPESFGGLFKKIRVRDFTTFHPDKTHLRREGLLKARPTTTDVSTIVAKLGAQLERLSKEKTETKDLAKLQAELARTRRELESAQEWIHKAKVGGFTAGKPVDPRIIRKAVEEAEGPLRREVNHLKADLKRAKGWVSQLRVVAKRLNDLADSAVLGEELPPEPVRPRFSEKTSLAAIPPRVVGPVDIEGEAHVKAGAVRMLRELASRHPMTLTRAQLGTLAGFTPSGGTFQTYFGVLKRLGYLEEDPQGNVRVTSVGMDFVGEVPPAPATPKETLEMWKRNLKAGAGRMLEEVVRSGPLSREDLAARTEFEVSGGTFQTYLGILRRNGLVEERGGEITATEVLLQ